MSRFISFEHNHIDLIVESRFPLSHLPAPRSWINHCSNVCALLHIDTDTDRLTVANLIDRVDMLFDISTVLTVIDTV